MALTTRNRFSRFIAALYESAVPSRDCHVASLLAMTHQGSAVVHQCPPAVECLCTRRSVSAATDAIGAYRFIDGRYESEVPPRDCHVGRWPPRNDKSEAGFILTKACTGRRRCAGRGMPLPYNARLEIGVLFILKSSVFIIHLFLHAPPLQRTTDSPAISLKIIQNSIILEATAPCRTIFTRK